MKPIIPADAPPGSTAARGDAKPMLAPETARVLRSFRIVFNAVKSHFREIERKTSLGGAQLWALSVIAEHPQLGVTALAKAMDIRQSTASNLVKHLADLGLITMTRGTIDRRTSLLCTLPAGAEVLQRAPGPFSGVLPQALARLDTETLRNLDRDLSRLITVLEGNPAAANIPLGDL